MRIHLVAIGRRMPSWISDGFREYAQRLRSGVQLELIEVEIPRRGQNVNLSRVVREEGARLIRATPSGAYRIALDQSGHSYDSE
ncbi:MAG TPA: 23S rRNA (pseudouridine(1915)-N(3))-methyltransferase RlmH, partial [Gammaproteobacteria bacterium]|nr:23S rRNA (pseudouridine(1915)-N(3))-methyltransferase RlmH [Gammaproteobacteria bacterium]